MKLTDPVRTLKGVGTKNESYLEHMGIRTIKELICYFPRTYITYEPAVGMSEVEPDRKQAVLVTLRKSLSQIPGGRVPKLTGTVEEEGRRLQCLWFHMPYLKKSLHPGTNYVFYGKIREEKGKYMMDQPEVYTPEKYRELCQHIQPVYSLTEGVGNRLMVRLMQQVFETCEKFEDYLPGAILKRYQLWDWDEAIRQIHFPTSANELGMARKRLAFDEFFLFALAIRRMKKSNTAVPNSFPILHFSPSERFIADLPYKLTSAQLRTWEEIKEDFKGIGTMNRLIQGDVGSGKTVIAQLALLTVAEEGYQGCLMAPTEVLARQHFESFEKVFSKWDIRCLLLTGSMTAKEKREAYTRIENHQVDIVIGTHALIQDKVQFAQLALVVTDEQHRFGVHQREYLASKGVSPHVLVMSATPIPRTLALILYGDLDISVIDEMPASRKPIKNCVVGTDYRPAAYRFIEKQIRGGRQAYIICPMVEESEWMELENVVDYTERLKTIFPASIRVEMLHGKMSGEEKRQIMETFGRNEIQVLVSTTVIEVGIDVPNATVMMIENAERFGLAQLHQLRGRVGRGKEQSYCIFIQCSKSETARKRLEILNHSNDGFYIASEDLKLRGPGDLFGLRQSGLMDFQIGDVYQDGDVLQMAGDCAAAWEDQVTGALAKRLSEYMSDENLSVIL